MKVTAVLDLNNRFRNKLYVGNKLLASGNNGLEELQLLQRGKRSMLQIVLSEGFAISFAQECPERQRFSLVRSAGGSRIEIDKLAPDCEMLRVSASACDGCPMCPDQ